MAVLVGFVTAAFSLSAAAYTPPKTGERYWDVSPDGRVFYVQKDGSFEEFKEESDCDEKLDYRTQVLVQLKCAEAFRSANKKRKRALTPTGTVRATNEYCLANYVPLSSAEILATQDAMDGEIAEAKTDLASTRKAKGMLSVAELQYEMGCLIEILYQRLDLDPRSSITWAQRKRMGAEQYKLPPHVGEPIAFPPHRPPTTMEYYKAGQRKDGERVAQ